MIPGVSSGTSSAEIPRWAGASGSVRTRSMQCVAHRPIEVQILVPLTTKWSSCSSARQRSPARSLPASGSLKPWHQISSARRMRSRCTCCSGVPAAAMVGPTFLTPNTATRRGTRVWLNSASHAIWSSTPRPRPPISTGHAGALHPRARARAGTRPGPPTRRTRPTSRGGGGRSRRGRRGALRSAASAGAYSSTRRTGRWVGCGASLRW